MGGPYARQHASDVSLQPTWNWLNLHVHGSKFVLTCCDFIINFISVFQLLEVRSDNKMRSLKKSESQQRSFQTLDLVVGMVTCTCCHILGPAVILVNIKKKKNESGPWGQGYNIQRWMVQSYHSDFWREHPSTGKHRQHVDSLCSMVVLAWWKTSCVCQTLNMFLFPYLYTAGRPLVLSVKVSYQN